MLISDYHFTWSNQRRWRRRVYTFEAIRVRLNTPTVTTNFFSLSYFKTTSKANGTFFKKLPPPFFFTCHFTASLKHVWHFTPNLNYNPQDVTKELLKIKKKGVGGGRRVKWLNIDRKIKAVRTFCKLWNCAIGRRPIKHENWEEGAFKRKDLTEIELSPHQLNTALHLWRGLPSAVGLDTCGNEHKESSSM